MDGRPQPWTRADEKYASKCPLHYLHGSFAWISWEVLGGDWFAAPWNASGECAHHGLHQTLPASADASPLCRISSPIF